MEMKLTVALLQEGAVDWYNKFLVPSPFCPPKVHLYVAIRGSRVNAIN